MKKSIFITVSKDGFSLSLAGVHLLTINRLEAENETEKQRLMLNYERAQQEAKALKNGNSKFPQAQENYNFLTK